MLDWKFPIGIKDLQSFPGFTNLYRRFIKGVSTIAHPLTNMLKKTGRFFFEEAESGLQAYSNSKYDPDETSLDSGVVFLGFCRG
jgi:hypothetical protein